MSKAAAGVTVRGIFDAVGASATHWYRSVTASLQVTVLPGGRRVFLPLVRRD